MTIDVVFTPLGLPAHEFQGRTVFVVDVLRATTTICAALARGARAIIPTGSIDEALKVAQNLEPQNVVLAGERNMLRIEGFALGNSPRDMTEEAVRGKTLVLATTNGTRAFLATQGAQAVYAAAAVNLAAAAQRARAVLDATGNLLLLCAGRESAFALEDAYVAGRLVFEALGRRWIRRGLNDAAIVSLDLVRRYGQRWDRPLGRSRAGRDLVRAGFAEDLALAGQEDLFPVLPHFHDRRIALAPPAEAG